MSVHVTPKLVSTHRGGSMYLTSPKQLHGLYLHKDDFFS